MLALIVALLVKGCSCVYLNKSFSYPAIHSDWLSVNVTGSVFSEFVTNGDCDLEVHLGSPVLHAIISIPPIGLNHKDIAIPVVRVPGVEGNRHNVTMQGCETIPGYPCATVCVGLLLINDGGCKYDVWSLGVMANASAGYPTLTYSCSPWKNASTGWEPVPDAQGLRLAEEGEASTGRAGLALAALAALGGASLVLLASRLRGIQPGRAPLLAVAP